MNVQLYFLSCRRNGVGDGDEDAWQTLQDLIAHGMSFYVPQASRFAEAEAMAATLQARTEATESKTIG